MTLMTSQDALWLTTGSQYMSTLLGMASGAQSVNGSLQSTAFDTSSFNSLAASGIWSNYSLLNVTKPAVLNNSAGGINISDVISCYDVGLSMVRSQTVALKNATLSLAGSRYFDSWSRPRILYEIAPAATLPYTRAVFLRPDPSNTSVSPIAVSFSLAGDG